MQSVLLALTCILLSTEPVSAEGDDDQCLDHHNVRLMTPECALSDKEIEEIWEVQRLRWEVQQSTRPPFVLDRTDHPSWQNSREDLTIAQLFERYGMPDVCVSHAESKESYEILCEEVNLTQKVGILSLGTGHSGGDRLLSCSAGILSEDWDVSWHQTDCGPEHDASDFYE